MDSFYDAPRQPPAPPTIRNLTRKPVVPEVSVVENSLYAPPRCFFNAEKPPCADSFMSMSRKQVRFEGKPDKENRPDLKGKSFKQIYMANVPDRHLDLSVFEPPPKHKTNLYSSREPPHKFNITETAPLRNVENKLALSPRLNDNRDVLPKCMDIAPANDEPTIRDLYRIIQQQNEQIMSLQRQMNSLQSSVRQPEIGSVCSPTKKGVISIIDVKTANFEVLYHNAHTKNRKGEATIQEIEEFNGGEADQNLFLRLDGPVEVNEHSVSSVTPNIDISMDGLDEYQSSEDDEEAPDFGITLYNGLMNQINNALRITSECPKQEVTGQTIKAVKQATLQHLKTMGVNLSPIQESNEITEGSELEDKQDVSFAVKQLLMKYLPDDKLTHALTQQKAQPVQKKSKPHNSELSFATVQYLKKYNIIGNSGRGKRRETEAKAPKFLDVTALKLQSKLDYKK